MEGVYMISVRIKAVPLKAGTRLLKIDKVLNYIPIAIDSDGKLMGDYFIKKAIRRDHLDKYRITYEVLSKIYLSGLCHNVKN
jgi:hypothetical protein